MLRALLVLGLMLAAAALPGVAFAQSSPSAFTTGYRYDAAGRLTGVISPDPDGAGVLHYSAVRYTYNSRGLVWKVEKGELAAWQSDTVAPPSWSGFTVFATSETLYDAQDRKVVERLRGSDSQLKSLTQLSYDDASRLQCTAMRMNPAIYGALPTSACSLGTQGSDGPDRVSKVIYDAAGQVVQVRKAVGVTSGAAIEQAEVTYSYTPNGKRELVVDANGNRAKLEYDGFDRQSKWIFPSTTRPSGYNPAASAATILATPGTSGAAGALNTSSYEQYGYDPNGNRTSLRKRDGLVITWQYDWLNRTTLKVVPERSGLSSTHTRDVYYGYDAWGRMTSARFDSASGEGVTTAYDGFGRITSSALTMDGTSRTLSYAYDADGSRTKITHPDTFTFWTCYDGLDRADQSWWGGTVACPSTPGGSASVSGATQFADIDYNASGLRSTINRASSYTDYTLDSASRLSSLAQRFAGSVGNMTQTFTYNPANQILTRATNNNAFVWTGSYNVNRNYSNNGLNQYSSAASAAGTTNFAYDANGNLTSDTSTVFTYDVENRLVVANGAKNGTLRYDPLGRLYESSGPSGVIRFLHDGDHIVGEYAANGTQLRRYFWGPGADEPILWDEGSAMNCSGTRFLHENHQGSIIALADCSGNQTGINRYDEYGIPQIGNVGRFQYTGQAWLPDLGMSYYKARMYSPTLGRFMQTDPIGYKDQFNLYAYVANDPVNRSDPSGKNSEAGFKRLADAMHEGIDQDEPAELSKALSQIFGAISDFITNNQEMRNENRDGVDKGYHCKANCEASMRGRYGERAAQRLSNAREVYGEWIKRDPKTDKVEDQAANRAGREAGSRARNESSTPQQRENICRAACGGLRPPNSEQPTRPLPFPPEPPRPKLEDGI